MTYARPQPDLRCLPADKWLPIAYRSRDEGTWVAVPGALLSIETAHRLEHDDLIFMATKPEAAAFALVVRRRAA